MDNPYNHHMKMEGRVLHRQLKAAGFDVKPLIAHPIFRKAIAEYMKYKLDFAGLADICETLALFKPSIKLCSIPKEDK